MKLADVLVKPILSENKGGIVLGGGTSKKLGRHPRERSARR